ncbi:recombinase family protein [Clostridium sp. CCUG 7971]|uniref:recombinase family protein n=1 Tax=Clostridium sp. CCUG 7971 TaxID=2811414 RepID=UPI001ABB45B1|nr:recombinase family protein [Clostridium sp. CCUG 7971]MBO3446389.1 recombinase family protein [Clostridium sp. CCUG 7971]
MKIAIYSRKSVFTGKGESIENQIQLCKDYIKLHYPNVTYIKIYEDEGFSGGSTNRPKFQEMMNSAKLKEFDMMLCYRLDRVSRNIGDFANLIDDLQKHNISFVSIKEQFDTSTPMGRAMMYISSVFAQLERETIAERVKDNMLELAKSGRWLGGMPPLGFDSESMTYIDEEMKERKMSKLIVNKKEMNLVKIIYNKYLELGSINQVVSYLQEGKYKSKRDKYFTASTVSKILSNPVYVKSNVNVLEYLRNKGMLVTGDKEGYGILTYNKRDNAFNKRDVSEWIAAVAKHKGIIDADKWLLVQNMLLKNKDKNKTMRLGTSSKGILSGLIRCANCGSPMRVSYGRNHHYYACTLAITSKRSLCDNPNVKGIDIEQAVVDNIMNLDKTKLLGKLALDDASITDNKSLLKSLESKIKNKRNQLNNLIDKLADFNSDVTQILKDKINDITSEIKDLESKYNYILDDINNTNNSIKNIGIVLNALDEFKTHYNKIDDIKKKKFMLGLIIDTLTWNGNTEEIEMNFWGSKKKE